MVGFVYPGLSVQRHLPGDGPDKGGHFTRDGHRDLVGMFTASEQLPIALTEPNLGAPRDGVNGLCDLFEA